MRDERNITKYSIIITLNQNNRGKINEFLSGGRGLPSVACGAHGLGGER